MALCVNDCNTLYCANSVLLLGLSVSSVEL